MVEWMVESRERLGDVSRVATEGLLQQPRPTSHRLRHLGCTHPTTVDVTRSIEHYPTQSRELCVSGSCRVAGSIQQFRQGRE